MFEVLIRSNAIRIADLCRRTYKNKILKNFVIVLFVNYIYQVFLTDSLRVIIMIVMYR